MAEEATNAADVNAAEAQVDTSTTTTDTSSEDKKETKPTESDQSKADKEIAKDLLTDDKDKAKADGADDSEEEEEAKKPEDEEAKAEEEAEPQPTEEEKAAEVAKGAEARKLALQTEIRELVAKRNEARKEVEEANNKAYRTETPEELIEKGLTPEEAENEVLKQEMQLKDYNIRVADLQSNLNIEALQVMQDFPVFDPDSAQFDEGLRNKVRELYQKAAQPQVDQKTGFIKQTNILPYEFYKAFADVQAASSEKSKAEGKIEGQRAADKQLEAAETPTSAAPKPKKTDDFLKGLLS